MDLKLICNKCGKEVEITSPIDAITKYLEGVSTAGPGPQGPAGVDGRTPVKGVDYSDGADGHTPIKGVDYSDGEPGAPGVDGSDGANSTVPGPQGPAGADGYTPIKGVDYFDGAQGAAGTPGAKGDNGAASTIPGPEGTPGAKGDQGNPGADGAKGNTGDQGIQGIQGIQGPAGGQPVGQTVLSNDTLAQALAANINTKLTVTAARTLTTTVPPAGTRCSVMILTSGTATYTITFGTGFKPVGTLATGTANARIFVVNFISDGTNLYEAGRTAAMVA